MEAGAAGKARRESSGAVRATSRAYVRSTGRGRPDADGNRLCRATLSRRSPPGRRLPGTAVTLNAPSFSTHPRTSAKEAKMGIPSTGRRVAGVGLAMAAALLSAGSAGAEGFYPVGGMYASRVSAAAVALADGNVLVVSKNSVEEFFSSGRAFGLVAFLSANHGSGLTATVLADGRVLIGEAVRGRFANDRRDLRPSDQRRHADREVSRLRGPSTRPRCSRTAECWWPEGTVTTSTTPRWRPPRSTTRRPAASRRRATWRARARTPRQLVCPTVACS